MLLNKSTPQDSHIIKVIRDDGPIMGHPGISLRYIMADIDTDNWFSIVSIATNKVFKDEELIHDRLSNKYQYIYFDGMYMHVNYFDNLLRMVSSGGTDATLVNRLSSIYYRDMRHFLELHLMGKLIAFGYNKDSNLWKEVSAYNNQTEIHQIRNFRCASEAHIYKITDQMNLLQKKG